MIPCAEPRRPGAEDLERQRAYLRQHADDLLADLREGFAAGDLEVQFVLLRARARVHWAAEEELMLEGGYPGRLEHGEEHARLGSELACVHGLFVQYGACPAVAAELARIADRWFLVHVAGADAQLRRWLAAGAGTGRRPGAP